MKSGKQRRAELDARKKARVEKVAAVKRAAEKARSVRENADSVRMDHAALAPHNSYGAPEYVAPGGAYRDRPFECRDCGKAEVWTAGQQKWWYEVAKGPVYSEARRCRACRRRERERRDEARRVHLEGSHASERSPPDH
jgi:hypothetical protein